MGEFIPLGPLLTALGIMLTLSIFVERVLMVFSWIIDRVSVLKSLMAEDVVGGQRQKLARIRRAVREEEILAEETPTSTDAREIEPHPDSTEPDVDFEILPYAVDDPDRVMKEFWLQKLGFVVAVAGCYYMKFSMWQLFDWLPSVTAGSPHFWEYLLTGVVIGAGSKPVHFLMKFVLNRKIVVSREEVRQSVGKAPADQKPEDQVAVVPATPAPPAPAIVPVQSRILEVFGFEYDGGYRPDRLEYTHLRKRPIDMIIYHHTAMHSDAPYEAIVQEFERRGWLTGYHSVVFANGQVRTICRWDRIGNHTRGYNARSLGLAFHGNFEPDPSVPYSNPDGRYGILFPTPLQVDRGARLVALWILLYNIAVDFDQAIVPHNKLAPKACPGSNFPHQAFHEKINHYLNLWKSDPDMQAVIQEFSNYPMVKA